MPYAHGPPQPINRVTTELSLKIAHPIIRGKLSHGEGSICLKEKLGVQRSLTEIALASTCCPVRVQSGLRWRCRMKCLLKELCGQEQGQDIAEYAVMLAVILVLVVGTIRLIGGSSNNVFSSVASSIGQ